MPWAPEGYTEAISIGDLLLRTAERHPDLDALVFPDRRVSYAELAGQGAADRPRPDRRRACSRARRSAT